MDAFRRFTIGRTLVPRLLGKGSSAQLVVIFLAAAASSLVSAYPAYTFFRASQYLIAIALVGFMIEDLEDYGRIVRALYFFGLMNLIYVAAGVFLYSDVVAHWEGARLSGGGVFRSDLGAVPFTVSVLSLCYFFIAKNLKRRLLAGALFALAFSLLFLYQTRHFLYPFPVYFLYITLFYRKVRLRSLALLLLATVAISILISWGFPIFGLFTRRGIQSNTRVTTWQVVLENRQSIPAFGFGFLGTPVFLSPIKSSLERSGTAITADPHNYFLTSLTDFGFAGLAFAILFVLFLVRLIYRSMKAAKYAPSNVLAPGLICIVIHGIISAFVTNFLLTQIGLLTMVEIVSIMLLDRISGISRQNVSRPPTFRGNVILHATGNPR